MPQKKNVKMVAFVLSAMLAGLFALGLPVLADSNVVGVPGGACQVTVIGAGDATIVASTTPTTGFSNGHFLQSNGSAVVASTGLTFLSGVLGYSGATDFKMGTSSDQKVIIKQHDLTRLSIPADGSVALSAESGAELDLGVGGDVYLFDATGKAQVGLDNAGELQLYAADHAFIDSTIKTGLGNAVIPTVANTSAASCGTTAATLAGNNNTGIVTVGAVGGTSCTVTFSYAATNRRQCVVNNETVANLVRSTYTDTTHSVFAGTFVAGDVLSYICLTY